MMHRGIRSIVPVPAPVRIAQLSMVLALVLVLGASCAPPAGMGSGTDRDLPTPGRQITLDRLYDTEDFEPDSIGPIRWLEDGSGYTTLEDTEGGGQDLVRHDPETGQTEVLVAAAHLTPPDAEVPLDVADYRWSADGRRLLVFTNTRRVWRQNTRGDYWVLDLDPGDGGGLRRIGGDLEETWFQFAKLSPDGGRVAFVHRGDLWVEDLSRGGGDAKGEGAALLRLTDTGSDLVTNGTFDWVYEEEWGLRDGFRWSPDGERIAFWQIDATAVAEFTLVDYTSELYPKLTRFPYPKAGTENPRCRIGVIDAARGGPVRWIDLPGDERDDYVARMEWAAGSTEIVLQRINRRQNENLVLLADVETGRAREVFRDEDEAWVEVCDDLVWLEDGARFTFVSERDGWSHVYVVSRDGTEVRLVTGGDYDVTRVARIDESGGFVYFIASPDDPTQRFLYRVPLAGGVGAPQRVTPSGDGGTHAYDVSPDARFAVHTHSRFGVPERVTLVSLPDHEVLQTFVTNETLAANLEALDRGPVEFFRVPIGDGLEADGYAILPPGFDPARRYPLLVYVYGEPAGQTVLDRWGGEKYLWHLVLSQMGFVVASFDNRGTPAPRGRAWRKSVYGQVGILASGDQAAAVRALLDRRDCLDRERVAVWGWSGGGSMTLNALFRYPDLYRAGIAIAFVADMRYYDTIYQERYMGHPDDNPEGFENGSPITFADRLEGDLLIAYGTGDDNCHYQNCEALVNRLVEHGKRFEMMVYPGRTHAIREGEGTRKHLYTTMTRFLNEKTGTGPVSRVAGGM